MDKIKNGMGFTHPQKEGYGLVVDKDYSENEIRVVWHKPGTLGMPKNRYLKEDIFKDQYNVVS